MSDKKTALMRLRELEHPGKTIDELLTAGPLRQVARMLHIDHTTVLQWKRRRGLARGEYCYQHRRWSQGPCRACRGK